VERGARQRRVPEAGYAGTNEVVEYWTCERLITVVNQTVVVRDDPNPFWHGELPFTVATTLPDLFTVQGISEVETIIDLARALTRSMNQRLDNADFANNGMVWYDPNDEPARPRTPHLEAEEPRAARERRTRGGSSRRTPPSSTAL
jgi:hypothetical protein